jgi:hypothetical protein
MVYDGYTPRVLMRLVLCNGFILYAWSSITNNGTIAAERRGREISISK